MAAIAIFSSVDSSVVSMTARELAERAVGYFMRQSNSTDCIAYIESLLSEALAEAHLQGVQRTLCCCEVKKDCDCKKEARAEAFEEAARICYCFQAGTVKQLGGKCMCPGCVFAEAIRRAGEGK